VPDNWIPMVPVKSSQGELFLRRGTMEIPTATGFIDLKAHALILEPQHPLFVADRVISRAGLLVDRYFRRIRSSDGSTFVWIVCRRPFVCCDFRLHPHRRFHPRIHHRGDSLDRLDHCGGWRRFSCRSAPSPKVVLPDARAVDMKALRLRPASEQRSLALLPLTSF
jgi:hypothetical protein